MPDSIRIRPDAGTMQGSNDCCIDNIYPPAPPPLLVHMKPCSPEDIPFGAVVSLINRSKYVFLNNRLRPLGLSAGQFPVLMLLAKEQNIMQDRSCPALPPRQGHDSTGSQET